MVHSGVRLLPFIALFLLLSTTLPVAHAIDQFEIQVYDSEINGPTQYTLENHVNYVFSGIKEPAFPGQIPANHLLHVTQELARGMNEYWELGFYYQSGITFPVDYHYAGVKFRSKFVVPRRVSGNFQFGANFEVSQVPHVFEDARYAIELRPILGYSFGSFTILVNPILGWTVSGETASSTPELSPALKAIWYAQHHAGLGLEYYGGIGPLSKLLPGRDQEHYLYGAYDLIDSAFELNLGVGKGLTHASNDFAVKTIIGFKL